MPGRCLVIANQTIGGADLDRAIGDCVAAGTTEFFVLVPLTSIEHEAAAWTGGLYLAGDELSAFAALAYDEEEADRRFREERDEARRRAEIRLDEMCTRIADAGGTADGILGGPDPVEATRKVFDEHPPFDAVIVSTLPRGLSRWLRLDLPSKLSTLTDVPITVIEAEADPPPTEAPDASGANGSAGDRG